MARNDGAVGKAIVDAAFEFPFRNVNIDSHQAVQFNPFGVVVLVRGMVVDFIEDDNAVRGGE